MVSMVSWKIHLQWHGKLIKTNSWMNHQTKKMLHLLDQLRQKMLGSMRQRGARARDRRAAAEQLGLVSQSLGRQVHGALDQLCDPETFRTMCQNSLPQPMETDTSGSQVTTKSFLLQAPACLAAVALPPLSTSGR